MVRPVNGAVGAIDMSTYGTGYAPNGPFYGSKTRTGWQGGAYVFRETDFDISRVVPTGAANKPRAWGALACCYLGQPA